ncbi:hypothetical protein EWM62_15015 [Mucilaginibacter terrigena]|uniref:Uncharacterized protein n=1 Tax=Mucilaginibacter terrigena TaxID=2492395 RepID=A0A4Q5LJL0_9SPHI|nr:hypothetical protein [Mucilaginibacter terrigena]RYU89621.1 hypothetical protein EWM62_15015 [Mucilaginibacter terrigena]
MKKLAFSLLVITAILFVNDSFAQSRGNASDWRIPPPYIPSEPGARLAQVKLPAIAAPEPVLAAADLEPETPEMPALPDADLPVVLPSVKSSFNLYKPATNLPGTPTTPGYWSVESAAGTAAYYWHSGVAADPYAAGPGYYDNNTAGWVGLFKGIEAGPIYWQSPQGNNGQQGQAPGPVPQLFNYTPDIIIATSILLF